MLLCFAVSPDCGPSRLGFGFWRDRNPISTRIELGCLGLAGVLWLGKFPKKISGRDSVTEAAASFSTRGVPCFF